MFEPTSNPYQFKYLQTGISGEGIKQVYLPEVPSEEKILFKKENKFIRPEMSEALRKEARMWRKNFDAGIDYVSPLASKIQEWEDQEWERSENGIWFWNNGTPTYITPFYYFYLSSWQTYFGYVDYRETDKEITYLLMYVEEDPDCFGLLLNTIRRYGKSSLMGAWATYRTIRNYGHYTGMQGEKDDKVAKFYNQMVKKPFLKLPYYYKPQYDTSTTLASEIKFERTTKRGKAAVPDEDDDEEPLESVIDYRPSGEAEYDGSILHSYLAEEPGKCHGKDTPILMHDGSIKMVQDVKKGDLIMGDDSSARKVLELASGVGKIYKVIPTNNKAKPWTVNEDHILSCRSSVPNMFKKFQQGDNLIIPLSEYLKLSDYKKRHLSMYRVAVEYPKQQHNIDPYFLGLWLGDGSSRATEITNVDNEIVDWLTFYCKENNFELYAKKCSNRAQTYSIKAGKNSLREEFRANNLFFNKHIPKKYLIDSRKNRLELLAGIIDSDGHRSSKSRPDRSYEIVQKNKLLSEQIFELARSLGFYSSFKKKKASMKRKDGSMYYCEVYRVCIYGWDLHEIPCKVLRKKMPIYKSNWNAKNPTRYGFKIEFDRVDNYYGFNITGNHLYCLGDYTVTHNTLTANVNERWKIVKPCLRKGRKIRGKAFMGTTCEFMEVTNKGGKAYKKLFYDSDFDDRQPDGRTKSGLYVAFLPGDCAYEGYYDEFGIPHRESAKAALLQERESVKDDPKDLSDLIRKYPLSIKEIFYINTERCEFNAAILQETRANLDIATEPFFSRVDFYWDNNVRFSKIRYRHNPLGGWCKVSWLPSDVDKEANLVDKKPGSGRMEYSPRNDNKFCAGIDPIDHGVIIEGKQSSGDDDFTSSRRSKPVLMLKSKYDTAIDGVMDQDTMDLRAKEKYQYKTNKYILMMDTRPNDPNVLYERALMICWFFGVSLHVEAQKYSIINYFHDHGCGGFILNKYEPDWMKKKVITTEGTPASQTIIQDYTSCIATYVEYFGHTIPFREVVEDLLQFNPRKTTEYDYTVAMGFTELSSKIRPKTKPLEIIDLSKFMNSFDSNGELCN